MLKKVFDADHPECLETQSALTQVQEFKLEADMTKAAEALTQATDHNAREKIMTQIFKIADDMAGRNWDRAMEMVTDHIVECDTNLNDDLIRDLIDIALKDPQIQNMNKVMNITGGYSFRQLADVPEIMAHTPREGALRLLEIADAYAHEGSSVLREVHLIRSALDPSFDAPETARLMLH